MSMCYNRLMEKLKVLFQKATQPQSTDDEQAHRENMVRTVLVMVVLTLIPLTLIVAISFIAGVFPAQPLIMVVSIDAAIAVCSFLVSRSHWQVAGNLIILSFFILAAYGSFINGLMTTLVLTYAVVVLLVSMFDGGKASWFVLAASILTHSLLGAFRDQKPINAMLVSMVVTAFCLTGVALLQWLATRLLRTALADERSAKKKMSQEIEERKQLELQLHFWGMHDAMTGLYNRFYFEAELERLQFSRLFPISIIMVDVDSLKHINDNFGHAFGDMLL